MHTLTTNATYDAKRKILIPQEFPPYRQFTVRVIFIPKEDVIEGSIDSLQQALEEVAQNKTVGPFQTISELKKSLET